MPQREHSVGAKTGVNLQYLREASQQESRRGNQKQRESGFAYYQSCPQPLGSPALSAPSTLQSIEVFLASRLQRGRQAKQNSGSQRNHRTESEHSDVYRRVDRAGQRLGRNGNQSA